MPIVYGKSLFSIIGDIDKEIDLFIKRNESTKIANYLVSFWIHRFPDIHNLMKLVNEVGWITSFMNRPVCYTNSFITTSQDYMKSKYIHVWVYNKKTSHFINVPTTYRDRAKSMRATFANFIHQLDASIANFVILSASRQNIPIYSVHDNFITTPF